MLASTGVRVISYSLICITSIPNDKTMNKSIRLNGQVVQEGRQPMNDDPKGFEIIDTSFSYKKNDIRKDLQEYKDKPVTYYYYTISGYSGILHIVRVLKKLENVN